MTDLFIVVGYLFVAKIVLLFYNNNIFDVTMPEGILDFFELVWAESQSLDSRERMTDQFPVYRTK